MTHATIVGQVFEYCDHRVRGFVGRITGQRGQLESSNLAHHCFGVAGTQSAPGSDGTPPKLSGCIVSSNSAVLCLMYSVCPRV